MCILLEFIILLAAAIGSCYEFWYSNNKMNKLLATDQYEVTQKVFSPGFLIL
jgi:hypothetical protein